jgi:hypothetical protein
MLISPRQKPGSGGFKNQITVRYNMKLNHNLKETTKTDPEIEVQSVGGSNTWKDVFAQKANSIGCGLRFIHGVSPNLQEAVVGLNFSFWLGASFDAGGLDFCVLRIKGYYAPESHSLLFRSFIQGRGPDQPWHLVSTRNPQLGNWLLAPAGRADWPNLREIMDRAHAFAELNLGTGSVQAPAIQRWLGTARKRKGK